MTRPKTPAPIVAPWDADQDGAHFCKSCEYFVPKLGDLGQCKAITDRYKSVRGTGPVILVMADSPACWSHATKAG